MEWAFESWADFLMMGRYAVYVWSAVGATCIILMGQLLYTLNQNKKIVAQTKRNVAHSQDHAVKNKEEIK